MIIAQYAEFGTFVAGEEDCFKHCLKSNDEVYILTKKEYNKLFSGMLLNKEGKVKVLEKGAIIGSQG